MDLVGVWNLALGHVGEGTTVADPDEQTTIARVCRRMWDQSRDAVLAEHPWSWARRLSTLVAYAPVPDGWSYAYVAPPDIITVLSLNPTWVDAWSTANDVWWTDTTGAIWAGSTMAAAMAPQVRWTIGGDTDEDGIDTPLVLADTLLSSMSYTRRVENTEIYPPVFCDAVAWRLAYDICIPLSRSSEIRSLAWASYRERLSTAAALDARQRRDRRMPDAEHILERGA